MFEDESEVASAIRLLAGAVTPPGAAGATDASGGYVGSATEALMGMTSALQDVATALHEIADAIRDREPGDEGQ